MEAKAVGRHLRISPQKLRLVGDLVRGKNAGMALIDLKFVSKKGALIISKLITAAISNSSKNSLIDVDSLYIKTLIIDGGPSIKRIRPMPMGRAGRIIKRSSHVTVILSEK